MIKVYFIITVVMTVLFTVFYIPADRARAARVEALEQAKEAKLREAEEERKKVEEALKEDERKKREEAERRLQEEEAKAIADQRAKNEQIRAETQRLRSQVAESTALLKRREEEVRTARDSRLAFLKQIFEARKANELFRINVRTAETNYQRALELLATRSNASAPALLPPLPPAGTAPAPRS